MKTYSGWIQDFDETAKYKGEVFPLGENGIKPDFILKAASLEEAISRLSLEYMPHDKRPLMTGNLKDCVLLDIPLQGIAGGKKVYASDPEALEVVQELKNLGLF